MKGVSLTRSLSSSRTGKQKLGSYAVVDCPLAAVVVSSWDMYYQIETLSPSMIRHVSTSCNGRLNRRIQCNYSYISTSKLDHLPSPRFKLTTGPSPSVWLK